MYRIGAFSKMNRVTIKALRFYDEVGLLKPAYTDEWTGYRYYTSEQLPQLHRILALRQMGFSLEEIAGAEQGADLEALLKHKKIQLLQAIADTTHKLSQVEHYLLLGKEGWGMKGNPVLKELPEVTVASIRRIMKSYNDLFELVPPMGQEMERVGCVCLEPAYCFNIYHDGEYKEEDIDVEVCEAVLAAKEGSEWLQFRVIPRVPQAICVLHRGPYSRLYEAYAALHKWMVNNGYELSDHPREAYIDGIWNKSSEEEWLTEVQFPVRKL